MKQDHPHKLMEVIFVDDGSEDNTFFIIEEYSPKMDMKVKTIINGKDLVILEMLWYGMLLENISFGWMAT